MRDWIKEVENPAERKWEEFYRNRFQHDKRVRTTHGVNCTGSCSWEVFVKDGIVTWELQATDYPSLEAGLPPYEPRGCQRGISFSWYLYSPIRVKYPYAKGALLDLWREAKKAHGDPVAAWEAIQNDPHKRKRYQKARGKGGFRRASWDEVLELIAAAVVSTVKRYGPDRVIGFSPIPAMSQISYAAGSRFLSLLGGVPMTFYDWYCDLPNASPEIWGEQTDVHESADWYNARFIAVMGSNLNMTRTPDTHFIAEVRHAGAKLTVFSPDFSQVSKYADWWIPIHPGQDGAFWMAVNHVLLKEFYADREVPYFQDYLKRYTDAPFLVEIKDGRPGRYLRANRLAEYAEEENGDFKLLVFDEAKGPRMPMGTLGFRWQKEKGKWNLKLEDPRTGEPLNPRLSLLGVEDEVVLVEFDDFAADRRLKRGVPVKYVVTKDGERVAVATVFDLLMAQFGVGRGLPGDYPASYEDDLPYTPAWQEKWTGIHRDTLLKYARAWGENGLKTKGRNLIIIGAGINHWYHNNLMYRAGIVALMLTGSVGVNGGGLAHYVGQEKLANQASWAPIAFATDWGYPPRQQNTPSFHYVHSDQWRYERGFSAYDKTAKGLSDHTIDHQVRAVRKGWLPFFPQFNKSPLEVVAEAEAKGAKTEAEIVQYVVEALKRGELRFAVEDPDAPENWPRVWFIWRGNAIGTSAKGHEYFLKHYLGTHTNAIAEEVAEGHVTEVVYRKPAPEGKLDLVVDLNFRMDTSALYSDIVLPAATWYEKDDLNTTDLHTFINPLQAAVPPAWESKPDWEIFKAIAKKVSELARVHLPRPVKDLVMIPLQHDTPDELAQLEDRDWKRGEVEPIPGKTMPKFRVVERDYTKLYEKFVTLGPTVEKVGVGMHGLTIPVEDFYKELAERQPRLYEGEKRPSLEEARQVAEAILLLDPVSNGELAYRAFLDEEKKTGVKLTDLAEGNRHVRISFKDIVAQPRRQLTTPTWSAIINHGRAYSPYTLNVERLVPWRTLTGRQHFYLDHPNYLAWGEHLPTYKPRPEVHMLQETEKAAKEAQGKLMNYITPHGKWSIHSTYSENHRMMTLSRGGYPVWLNDKDAAELGIRDNDWVELFNDNGVFVQRAIVSARIPRGTVFVYHATERTVGIPKSPLRGKRAGMNNSITRARLKPVLMSGGYAQFTYAFNYWGPVGVNRDTWVYVRKLETPPEW
ncbi:nitrate reductase subunit alpha [Thermus thermophilus]|uniref:nitrate reductase (quinone) n=1 Tax=Thermus thermophilus TaxID=274 RepID=O06459_THETH|nr:nitrate reductase subunit alpha [Thermus thermophilus]QMV32163.1 Respiratory nitrate reductase 1 alpha chain [Thermus thermophilus]CAA71210.2 nitrate reductase alpha subunit [Thermus thermophilus HB8]VCU54748.1 Respiratory nitrate reductase 1 alpha chain [Thermus thermophilus]